jgi:hypothetical protein
MDSLHKEKTGKTKGPTTKNVGRKDTDRSSNVHEEEER